MNETLKQTANQDDIKASIDRLFGEWDNANSPGAALAIIKDNTIFYQRGYGMANLEYNIPITPSTIFDIASVSKQFGGMAIAILAQEGKLSLDDDIRKHLPDIPNFGKTITVRHLVHHTSGIRDWVQSLVIAGGQMDDVISFKHILKMVRRQKRLNFEPGAEFLYSNTGYNLLAEIVEKVTGDSFRDWTEAEMFKPLAMTNTHFHDDHEMIVKNRAYSYSSHDKDGYKHAVNNLTALASSSLYTTVEDLAKWIFNFDHKRVGNAAVIEQMHQQGRLNNGKQLDYAFGQRVAEYRGLRIVDHSGSWRGFRSILLRFPEQRFAVTILSNLASFSPERLARQIADICLADQFTSDPPQAERIEQEGSRDAPSLPANLTEFVGDYHTDELDTTYTIVVQDDQLVVQHQRHDDIPLTYVGPHFASRTWFFPEIHFTRDAESRITGFELTGGRVRNLWFSKAL